MYRRRWNWHWHDSFEKNFSLISSRQNQNIKKYKKTRQRQTAAGWLDEDTPKPAGRDGCWGGWWWLLGFFAAIKQICAYQSPSSVNICELFCEKDLLKILPSPFFFFLPSRRPFPPFSLSVLPRLFTKAIAHLYEINPHRNIQRAFFFFIRHTRARSFILSLLAHHIHPPPLFFILLLFSSFLLFFTGRCSIDIPFGANLVGRW